MYRRTSAILAAILVVGLMGTTTADAVKRYDWRLCSDPDSQCDGPWEDYPMFQDAGDEFSVYVDIDELIPGPISSGLFWVLFQSSQVTFVNVRRSQVDPGSPVACKSGPNAGPYIPIDCPDCLSEVKCEVADWFWDGGLDIVGPSEVELVFRVNQDNDTERVTMIAPDWFYPLDEDGSDLNGGTYDGNPSGPIGVLVQVMVPVPEPGEMAMLAAGLPLLAAFAIRRNRRS